MKSYLRKHKPNTSNQPKHSSKGPNAKKHKPEDRRRGRDAPERRMPPTLNSMMEILRRSDIKLNREQTTQLWKYHNLMRARNTDQELTRIIGFEPIIVKHYVDCMIVGKFLQIPSPIVDVGTGAGFPGIPLKIRYPHLKIILAEPRPKRIAFLKEVIHELRLRNIEVFEHKVSSKSFQTPMKAVITRAVETIDKTMLRTSGCLEVGGSLIFLKGPAVDPEIQTVQRRFGPYFKLTTDKRYQLPHSGHSRRLIIFEKVKNFEEKAKQSEETAADETEDDYSAFD